MKKLTSLVALVVLLSVNILTPMVNAGELNEIPENTGIVLETNPENNSEDGGEGYDNVISNSYDEEPPFDRGGADLEAMKGEAEGYNENPENIPSESPLTEGEELDPFDPVDPENIGKPVNIYTK